MQLTVETGRLRAGAFTSQCVAEAFHQRVAEAMTTLFALVAADPPLFSYFIMRFLPLFKVMAGQHQRKGRAANFLSSAFFLRRAVFRLLPLGGIFFSTGNPLALSPSSCASRRKIPTSTLTARARIFFRRRFN
ncbi:hypothetical protein KSP39_PZI008312 [Platanthera zijinensis]|uniref:Uncharacterized protein n=1 Tax=Platanthera zijinensis TaxID=2320716 RepID=A0AAP0BNP4_9ASPA